MLAVGLCSAGCYGVGDEFEYAADDAALESAAVLVTPLPSVTRSAPEPEAAPGEDAGTKLDVPPDSGPPEASRDDSPDAKEVPEAEAGTSLEAAAAEASQPEASSAPEADPPPGSWGTCQGGCNTNNDCQAFCRTGVVTCCDTSTLVNGHGTCRQSPSGICTH